MSDHATETFLAWMLDQEHPGLTWPQLVANNAGSVREALEELRRLHAHIRRQAQRIRELDEALSDAEHRLSTPDPA